MHHKIGAPKLGEDYTNTEKGSLTELLRENREESITNPHDDKHTDMYLRTVFEESLRSQASAVGDPKQVRL